MVRMNKAVAALVTASAAQLGNAAPVGPQSRSPAQASPAPQQPYNPSPVPVTRRSGSYERRQINGDEAALLVMAGAVGVLAVVGAYVQCKKCCSGRCREHTSNADPSRPDQRGRSPARRRDTSPGGSSSQGIELGNLHRRSGSAERRSGSPSGQVGAGTRQSSSNARRSLSLQRPAPAASSPLARRN